MNEIEFHMSEEGFVVDRDNNVILNCRIYGIEQRRIALNGELDETLYHITCWNLYRADREINKKMSVPGYSIFKNLKEAYSKLKKYLEYDIAEKQHILKETSEKIAEISKNE